MVTERVTLQRFPVSEMGELHSQRIFRFSSSFVAAHKEILKIDSLHQGIEPIGLACPICQSGQLLMMNNPPINAYNLEVEDWQHVGNSADYKCHNCGAMSFAAYTFKEGPQRIPNV